MELLRCSKIRQTQQTPGKNKMSSVSKTALWQNKLHT